MSARGARSRKVQQKEVEKKEKHAVSKGKGPASIYEHEAGWRPSTAMTHAPSMHNSRTGMSRTFTESSTLSRTTSHSGSSNGGSSSRAPYSNASVQSRSRPPRTADAASITSDHSSKSKDKAKYQAKGKETKAPRGRGAGVPTKAIPVYAPPAFRSDSVASHPPMPTYHKSWANFMVWKGGKDGLLPYGGFDVDEDMQHGSVLIYFKEEQADDDIPIPSLRAELDVLQNSGSTWLLNALQYGQIDDNDVDDWNLSEDTSPPPQNFSRTLSQQHTQRRLYGQTPPDGTSARAESRTASSAQHLSGYSTMERSNSPPPFLGTHQRNPTHEIWFTAPSRIHTPQGQRLHHVAIRNFLALLHGKPIVGADIFEMLNTLQPEIQIMYDLESDAQSGLSARERSVHMITKYLTDHGFNDVRNSPKHAMALLAWAEQDAVRWRQGYLESFVHLSGIMNHELEEHPDFKRLSVVTRRSLGLAAKTLQLRVMEAEDKLTSFNFDDLYGDATKSTNSTVYQSYQAFRQFLVSYYTRNYGCWPPTPDRAWLNRKVARALQEDFGSLYDYLVDRDVVWYPREERSSRKWEMTHRQNSAFKADLPELGMTEMLVAYDNKNGYAHIPHPYPLLPKEVPKEGKDKEKKGFFSSLKKDKTKTSTPETTKDAKAQLQLSLIFTEATNIERLGVGFNGSTLIDEFEQFELTTDVKHVSPREARLGRWVLLYGILQLLSTLSVDVRDLQHTEDVWYFLNTDLKRVPEWVINNQAEYLEATQQQSWCWQRTWDHMSGKNAPVELEGSTTHDLVDHYLNSSNASGNTSIAEQPVPSRPQTEQALPPASSPPSSRPQTQQILPPVSSPAPSRPQTLEVLPPSASPLSSRPQTQKIFRSSASPPSSRPQTLEVLPPSASPPPSRPQTQQVRPASPPRPISRGVTMIQDDLRRISDKIESLSLSHAAGEHIRQAYERRRESEKGIPEGIPEEVEQEKPQLKVEVHRSQSRDGNTKHDSGADTSYTAHPETYSPRTDSLPRQQKSMPCLNNVSPLDFIARQGHSNSYLPPHLGLNPLRSHPPTMNMDLAAYSFSQAERDISWPAPPGFSEGSGSASTSPCGGVGGNREARILGSGSVAMVDISRKRVQPERGFL
ncbi:hypothetical protein PtrSN002B_002880 [Pyrenophora tritici-repentis]|uniref:DUF8004 domain-containing protein n=3 Tax=Pyrenophora tritici-repentis TaxID=45151 RepID=A0A2W1EIA8_9PLEO|nr:hypothetical protein PtrV1_11549 [Pyrenophora tritici-repentis]KAG9378596.1 hypothetical protein A1F94_010365 [Pyrenophora tritici-repentis]KAI0582291.1 hypothetical protein Alg215_04223 [Pyrenophora tritici-repentis]KAI0585406.1 hypothetical protein Alg130_04774 [Pyrenophora tritici-repentis]KAI0606398.1 hypothetical protein TUN205_09360 [Pyrenophora tritici-repentis]